MVHDWYTRLYTRDRLPAMEDQMDDRSVRDLLAGTDKPIFMCQGMQESLFPQIDEAWAGTPSFARTYIFTGGHGADNPECWRLTLDWFRFFLAGFDTEVDQWPALRTQDAAGGNEVAYDEFPETSRRTYHLRAPDLVEGQSSAATFTIDQRLASNPLVEPGALWDQMGAPYNAVPAQMRDDPAGVFFETGAFDAGAVLLGAPTLRLTAAHNSSAFQVTGMLFLESGTTSQVLTRAAISLPALEAGQAIDMRFDWVKADVAPGDRIVLKLSANDPSWFMPLLADYSVTFDGRSELALPFFGE
jgi:hypothetical protein